MCFVGSRCIHINPTHLHQQSQNASVPFLCMEINGYQTWMCGLKSLSIARVRGLQGFVAWKGVSRVSIEIAMERVCRN